MKDFIYNGQAGRVVFGPGSLGHLEREIERLGVQRAMVLSTAGKAHLADRVASCLGARAAGIFSQAVMHVPIETARQACEEARRLGADGVIAIGGGSTTGLGKAIAMDTGLPMVAIPTTYSGSEMTTVYGITQAGVKNTGKDPRVLPKTVIYDPELTLTLPVVLSVTSGMNAMAHAAEGLYGRDTNPVMNLMAEEGIRAIARALPAIREKADDVSARSDALYGAWLCGMVMSHVGMALHHKLCHTLGGSFGLAHAEVHTVVLPQALAFNALAAPEAMRRIEIALGVAGESSAAAALFDLAQHHGAPVALKDIGMKASDLDKAVDMAVSNPYWNPRHIGVEQKSEIRALLFNAYEGNRPA